MLIPVRAIAHILPPIHLASNLSNLLLDALISITPQHNPNSPRRLRRPTLPLHNIHNRRSDLFQNTRHIRHLILSKHATECRGTRYIILGLALLSRLTKMRREPTALDLRDALYPKNNVFLCNYSIWSILTRRASGAVSRKVLRSPNSRQRLKCTSRSCVVSAQGGGRIETLELEV
jgi:hypothetical protein